MRHALIAVALVSLVAACTGLTIAKDRDVPKDVKLVIELQVDPRHDELSSPVAYAVADGERRELKEAALPIGSELRGLQDFVVLTAKGSPGCIYYKVGGVLKKYCW